MRILRLVVCAFAILLLGACGGPLTKDADNVRVVTPSTPAPQLKVTTQTGPDDRTVETDLRNALTAEKTIYTDRQTYVAAPATMQQIEPSLRWGHELQVTVADAESPGDQNVVCLTETAATGTKFAIADVAEGPRAGTYYGRNGCPSPLTANAVSKLTSNGFS
jgi:hypothetical protein